MLMTMNLKLLLGSSARTETRSRRLATVTLLTFAQATVGLSVLAQLPPLDLMGAWKRSQTRLAFKNRNLVSFLQTSFFCTVHTLLVP